MQPTVSQEEEGAIQYLIICGAPKAATTSLFRYLADHPEVCPASRKETYFFAREFDHKNVCKIGETLASFETYFTHCNNSARLRVEATPYTLYAKGAAKKIATMLPNVAILFILRDPSERLFSNYQMQRQREHAYVQNKSFEEYVETLFRAEGDLPNNLQMGCYLEYLHSFFETFEQRRVHVLFFEEFQAAPAAQLQKLCETLGIDSGFYANYRFNTHNPSINVRYKWLNKMRMGLEPVVAHVRTHAMHSPSAHRVFEKVITSGKLALNTLNSQEPNNRESIQDEVWAKLANYYRPHNQALAEELGRSLPWNLFQQT